MGDILRRLSSPTYDIIQDPTRPLYSLEEGLLVVREVTRVRIVIPSGDLRIELLSIHHDSAGHPGKDRTLHALQQHFFWPNMARDVAKYCVSCMLCQAANAAAQKPLGFSQPYPVTSDHIPGHTWNIDFLSLPETAAGNNTCFVVIDKLSKIVIMAAMRMDPSAPLNSIAMAMVIFDRIYPFFSVAHEFTSDC